MENTVRRNRNSNQDVQALVSALAVIELLSQIKNQNNPSRVGILYRCNRPISKMRGETL